MNGFGNQCHRIAFVEGSYGTPFAGTFLSGYIQYMVYQCRTICFAIAEDVCGNLNQEAVQLTFIPLSKSIGYLIVVQFDAMFHHGVSFCNKLHIAIFYTVVNRLHKMSGASAAYPFAARSSVI